jgi:hypothetical protein
VEELATILPGVLSLRLLFGGYFEMAISSKLRLSRRGAWIINISKHLLNYDITDLGLSSLENILFAGKCGSLLIKLSADDTEQLTDKKVKAHARLCGIGAQELLVYLDTLKAFGCLNSDQAGTTYEVLAFSRQRVLETTSQILESSQLSAVENALPDLLEFCLLRPHLESEVREYLSTVLSEQDVEHLLSLVSAFELLGVIAIHDQPEQLFFNGYQFGDRAVDIGRALAALSKEKREELNVLLEEVARRPGTPPESLQVSDEIKTLAIGLGLVEISEVSSPAGSAKFLTTPRLAPPSVGRETAHLEEDVFHHAKMLLSSLRFGELRSSPARGRIIDPPTLVRALINRDIVGPCTAIGEDYIILEGEGVIRTIPATQKVGRQFYMALRRREPAEIVLGLLESGSSAAIDAKSLPRSLELPLRYIGPEKSRPIAAKRAATQDPETIRRFLEELRT